MTAEPQTITKKELVHRIAEQTDSTKVVVKDILQRFLDEIVKELAAGNRLEFREFGVFEVRERAARQAQNPRTLEKVHVPSKRVVKFKVGREMRQRVCDERVDERRARLRREREALQAKPTRTPVAPHHPVVPPPPPAPEPPATNSPF